MADSEIGTTTSNTRGGEYQVFLSFRGIDTRGGFTSVLHKALVNVGFRVYIDDKDLPLGKRISDELPQAIDNSKVYIPIFSTNYASSHWCLRELAQMVENTSISKEDGKEKVMLPIFYKVTPHDVKLKTELYKEAISNLKQNKEGREKKFSLKDRRMWMRALKEAGHIAGLELKKYQSDANLTEAAVEKVKRILKIRQRRVTEDLVGMEDRIAYVNNLLDIASSDERLIGIYGMGGIGKTTLANVIFNRLCPDFGENFSFLENVKHKATTTEGLLKLQEQLLSDISHSAHEIKNIDHGINRIEETICNKKALIVLDDVDKAEQIQQLLGEKPLFPGTRILVTTRDKDVLIKCRKHTFEKYEMGRLSNKDALTLFSRHAFRKDSPLADYYALSKSIVSTADGLPLALEAIGSSLLHEKREIWDEMLEKLKKTPHDDVVKKLKITYDALAHSQQQIFLDIACFFIGENKTNPMYVWKSCGFFPSIDTNILTRKCMIKVTSDNRFQMHDQLRDLGRTISREEGTRLWDGDEIIHQLRSKQVKEKVRALHLPWSDGIMVTSEHIKRFPCLQFLWLHGAPCKGDFMDCLFELKWISLSYGYSYPDRRRRNQHLEATNLLHLENVVVVNLSGLDITEDVFEGLMKGARKLKVVTIVCNTSIRGIPTFPQHSHLEKLTISYFESLREIDGSIEKLRQLTDLSFETCAVLQKLPKQIGRLHKLQTLSLRGCDLIELPDSVLQLVSLTKLDVSRTRIKKLPDPIGGLSSLLSVDVSLTPIEKLPGTMSELRRLQTLRLNHCDQIQELPELPRSLTILCLTSASLPAVPDLSDLTNLVELTLSDGSESMARSDSIQTCDLQWIASLSQLRKLHFCFSNVCAPTTELGSLSRLKELVLHGLGVPNFELLPSELIVIELYGTRGKQVRLPPSEEELYDTQGEQVRLPPSEEEFATDSSSSIDSEEKSARRQLELEHFEFFATSANVVRLQEEKCSELQAPEFIDHWNGDFLLPSSPNMLRKFILCGCPEVQDIQFVSTLESLLVFSVRGCTSLKRLAGLSNLKKLMELTLDRCPSLQVVEGIDELDFMHMLRIDGCRSMGRIFNASSSKIPNKCSTLITCSGELPDCGNTFFSWESYKEMILNGTNLAPPFENESTDSGTEIGEQAPDSETETKEAETETGDPLQETNQEHEDKERESKTVGKRTGKKERKMGLKLILGPKQPSRSQIAKIIGIRVLLPLSSCSSKLLLLDPRLSMSVEFGAT